MTEGTLQWIQFCKLIGLSCFAMLYALGGMSGKWKRRFVAPFLITAVLCGLSYWSGTFNWWLIGWFPLLSASLHLGYGADLFWDKMRRRAIYGLALGIAALPVAIGTQAWGLLGLHMVICVLTTVSLGVFNITSSARAEETFMAVMIAALPLAMV